MGKHFEVIFITLCFTGAVVLLPPPPPPLPPPGALSKPRSPAAGAPPPPPPPPRSPLATGGSGKPALSFADAIRQKVIERGGSVEQKSEEKAPRAIAPPPPPPPATKSTRRLSPISSTFSPTRKRTPTPFLRNSTRNSSDEFAPEPTPIRRRRPTPFVRKVTESEEAPKKRVSRVRGILASEENNENAASPRSELIATSGKTSRRRRNSTSSMSSASSFSSSSISTPSSRSRMPTPFPGRKVPKNSLMAEDFELESARNVRVREWREGQQLFGDEKDEEELDEFVAQPSTFLNTKFELDKMPESILLGFPLPPSPTGTFPAQFNAHDFSPNSNVMDYRRHVEDETDEGGVVQEVAISGDFLCGRTKRFHPAAVFLREFFWESGVQDRWETANHPKWAKRIVGLYALRPTFGSFTFKIVRPTASYQVHNGDDGETKISRKSRRRWRRNIRIGKKRRSAKKRTPNEQQAEDELPVLETEHSQFELVFDRGSCDNGHNYDTVSQSSNAPFDDLCLSVFALKPDWQERKWRKAMNAEGKCRPEFLDKQKDRICVHRVGDISSDADFVEKSLGSIRVDKCTGRDEDIPSKGGKKPRGDKLRTQKSSRRFWRN